MSSLPSFFGATVFTRTLPLFLALAWSASAWGQVPGSISITTQPEQTVAGQTLRPNGGPVVEVRDTLNAPMEGVEVTVVLNGGSLASGTTSVETGEDGRATFSDLVIHTAQADYSLTFTAGARTVTSADFPVVPAAPKTATLSTSPADTVYGSPIEGAPTVTLTDAFNNVVRNGVNITASLNGAALRAASTITVATGANGQAVFDNLVPRAAGTGFTLTFNTAAGGVPDVTSDPFQVTPLELTVGGSFTAEDKTYDGTTAAVIGTDSLVLQTPVAGDDVRLDDVVVAFSQTNAGTGIAVSITSAELDGDDKDNYTLSLGGAPVASATIDKAPLTINGEFTALDKAYDGTTTAQIDTDDLSLVGVVDGEDVALNAVANFAQSNIGTDITVNLTSSTISGAANLSNYSFSTVDAPTTEAAITEKILTIGGSFTAADKTYDTTTSATIVTDSLVLNGVVTGEDITLDAVAEFESAGIGTGLTVNLESSAISGPGIANYELQIAGAPTTTADITAQLVTIQGSFTAQDKAFDGTTAATIAINALTLDGVLNDQAVTLDAVANFDNAGPGNDILVHLDSSKLAGADAGNYQLSFVNAPDTTATISAKLVTIKGTFSVSDKTYDGTTAATVTVNDLQLDGLAPGDDTTELEAVANFSQSEVGADLTVRLLDSTLSGPLASGYTLSFSGAPHTTAAITVKELTVGGGFTAADKAYDGNKDASFLVDNLSLVGVVAGDTVTLAERPIEFAEKNVGSHTVSLTDGAALGGASAANYELSLTGAPTATASITALGLTIGGSFTAENKQYDGTTVATIDPADLTLQTPVPGDDVQLTGVSANFAQATVGSDIAVTITSAGLIGADAGNYSVTTDGAPTASADITAITLTIGGTFTAADKVYDGTTVATIDPTGLSLVGPIVVGNEVGANFVGTFVSSNVGTGIEVNLGSSSLTGQDAGNYLLDFTDAPTASAEITAKDLTITVGPSSVQAGQGVSDLSPEPVVTMDGLVPADTASDITGSPVVYTSAVLPATTTAGTYVDDLGVETNGDKAGNYDITLTKGTLTITAAAADKIVILAQPLQTTAGEEIGGMLVADPFGSSAPQVEVTDAFGNKVEGFSVTVSLSTAPDPTFASGATSKATGADGTAIFDDLVINTSGTAYFLVYSGSGVDPVNSEEFSVIAAAARELAVSVQPGDRAAGTEFVPAPTVVLVDSFGNPVLIGPYTINASLSPSASIIGPTSRATSSVDGTATFSGMSIRKAGTYTMGFASTAFGITPATSESFTISPQFNSAQVAISTQPTNTVAGVAIAPAPAVQVLDQYLNPVPNYAITAALNKSEFAAGSVSEVTTGPDGGATFADLRINEAGTDYGITFSFEAAAPDGGSTVVSSMFAVTHAAHDSFAFTTIEDQTAGQSFDLTITAQDEFGNTVTSFVSTADLTINPNSFATGGGTTPAFVAGELASHAVSITTAAADYEITATSGTITGTSNPFEVTAAAAADISLSGPSSVVAGVTSGNFTLTVKDAFGNITPVDSQTTFTLATNQEAATATFTPASLVLANGASSGTFAYRNTKVGTDAHTLTASFSAGDSGLTGESADAAITVTPAAAAKLAMVTQPPTTAQAGVVFLPQPSVRLLDAFDNNVPQADTQITVSIASGGPALEGSLAANTDATGVATFTDLAIGGAPGARTLVFASGSLATVTSTQVDITAGLAAVLTIDTEPDQARAGEVMTPTPSVKLTDAYGTVLADQVVSVTLLPDTAGSFTAGSTTEATTNAQGVAAFGNLKIDKAFSPYRLKFEIGEVSVQSRQFAVIAGTPTKLEMVAQPPQTATAGAALAPAPAVRALDEFNNPAPNVRVKVTPNGVSFADGTEDDLLTDVDGIATFDNVVINTAGTGYTLTFDTFVAGRPSVTSAVFEVKPDYAAAIMTVSRQPGLTTAGSAVAGPPQVTVKDQFGNDVSGMNVAATLNTGSFASGSTTTVATTVAGVANFSNLRVNTAGTYTLTFNLVNFSATATTSSFVVNPAAAAQLVMVTQPSETAQAGVAFARQPAVRVQDAFGNNVSAGGRTITAAVATGSGNLAGDVTAVSNAQGIATFTSLRIDGVTGVRTLRFSAPGLNEALSEVLSEALSGEILIGPGPAASIVMADEPTLTVAGEPILGFGKVPVAVTARDAFGNLVPGVEVTPSPTAGRFLLASGQEAVETDDEGLAKFDSMVTTDAGNSYTLTFSAGGLSVISAEFNVDPASPESLIILQQPFGGVIGSSLLPAPLVQLSDRYGNPTSSSTPFNIVLEAPPGVLSSESVTTVSTVGGRATFADLVPSQAATGVVLTFNIDGRPVNATLPFDILAVDPDPNTPTFLLLEGAQEDLVVGAERELAATLLNNAGQIVSSSASIEFAAVPDTGGTLTGLGAVTATAGEALITVTGETPGEVSVVATFDLGGGSLLTSAPLGFTVVGLELAIIRFEAAAPMDLATEGELATTSAPGHRSYELTFQITPGTWWVIESSDDLGGTWEPVLDGLADAAELTVEIPVPLSHRQGFWRVQGGPVNGPAENK